MRYGSLEMVLYPISIKVHAFEAMGTYSLRSLFGAHRRGTMCVASSQHNRPARDLHSILYIDSPFIVVAVVVVHCAWYRTYYYYLCQIN
jgi:hypothetical protein